MFYKRFLLFAGDTYYPSAYWNDFQGDFDTLDEAIEAYGASPSWVSAEYAAAHPKASWNDWGFIVDLETGAQRSLPDAYGR